MIGDGDTGKYGFIDKTGKIVIDPQFGFVTAFSEGLAAVKSSSDKTQTWGYISR